jgi:hypothetical protein
MLIIPRRRFIGIDPGVRGAVVILGDQQQILHSGNTPLLNMKSTGRGQYDLNTMWDLLVGARVGEVYCHIERSQAMPRDGSSSAWKTGCGFGYWEMGLVAAGIPYKVITPRVWQKKLFQGLPDLDTKTKSVMAARRALPELNLLRTQRSKKPDHNISDAGLIALHCWSEYHTNA